jgi:uncharacterized protein (TIGR00288 family)
MANDEDRVALFIDYENLALGARDRGVELDPALVMNALSERGRVVVRRAYADWNLFSDDRQKLIAQRIDLIEIPQRTGMVRKNAADIKLAVDALELAFERDYVTTFVVASGDSDFTPLVLKLRELNKLVIGVGVEGSTSQLLPGACDEFIFYERLLGPGSGRRRRRKQPESDGDGGDNGTEEGSDSDLAEIARIVSTTLSGLQHSSGGPVLSSMIKRVVLRKDPTFSEGDYGYRSWSELMRHLEKESVIQLEAGSAQGDPVVDFPRDGGGEGAAFQLLHDVVADIEKEGGEQPFLSGLKNELRKRKRDFSEKAYGYGGFLQFVKAARAKGLVDLEWNDEADDYVLTTRG